MKKETSRAVAFSHCFIILLELGARPGRSAINTGGGGRPRPRYLHRGETPTRVKKSRSNVLVVSPRPKPSGSLRVIGLLRQSYITLHLYQTNWLAFYGQLLPRTAMDALMDNRQTQSPYGRCRSRFGTYNPKSFSLSLFFFSPPTLNKWLGESVIYTG